MPSFITKEPIYCCFGWHNFFFYTTLHKFTISVKNAFLGLFFRKQKGAKIFQ